MFPNEQDRLDLNVIANRCSEGRYEGPSKLITLFDDLHRMCRNGKQFNSSNNGFQPWILADMMEKSVLRLQDDLLCGQLSASNSVSTSLNLEIGLQTKETLAVSESISMMGIEKDPYEEEEKRGVRRSLELEEV